MLFLLDASIYRVSSYSNRIASGRHKVECVRLHAVTGGSSLLLLLTSLRHAVFLLVMRDIWVIRFVIS